MIGTWKWNVWSAAVIALITFMLSISANLLVTAIWRSIYAFIIVFAIIFVFRWLFGTAAGLKHFDTGDLSSEISNSAGSTVDLTTPPDEELNDLLKEQIAQQSGVATSQFEPLDPPKFASKDKLDPALLADSLRQMSEN